MWNVFVGFVGAFDIAFKIFLENILFLEYIEEASRFMAWIEIMANYLSKVVIQSEEFVFQGRREPQNLKKFTIE